MLYYKNSLLAGFAKEIKDDYQIDIQEKTKTNLVNIMTNEFQTGSGKTTYADCILINQDGEDYITSESFNDMLKDENFFNAVNEVIEFGIYRYEKDYSDRYGNTSFQLYSKYTYEDVCRLLEWEKNLNAQNIGGYKYDDATKTYPVFINYNKDEDIAATIRYEDEFISPSKLIAISKSKRKVTSPDVERALKAKELGIDMELFVRKNKDDNESKEFYYLGKITATGETEEFIMPGTDSSAVKIHYALDTPVREDIYDYITN